MATGGTPRTPRPAPDGLPDRHAGRGGPGHGAQGHYRLSHLDALEAQAIHIFREVAAEFERPVLLFSGGKDSIVMLYLARKAFWPAPIPFSVLHVDTGRNFTEVLEYRDRTVDALGVRLVVAHVQDDIDAGRVVEAPGGTRNPLQTTTLLRAITEGEHDAVFGGARRDEEKARAKERIFSFRDRYGQWDPKNQRPEFWNLYNGRIEPGQSMRVFPLSNWTELDVWEYIRRENVPVVPLYFAKEREMLVRGDYLIPLDHPIQLLPGEKPQRVMCRMRSLGCTYCTGAIRSTATTVSDIIEELKFFRRSERENRVIDHDQEGSMEMKKREGYF